MNIGTHFLVYTNFVSLGKATSDPIDSFTEAAWEYSETRGRNHDAVVFRVDPPVNGQAGMMTDVTAEAEDKLRQMQRFDEWPHWLDPREPEEIAREAAIERRTETMLRRQMEAAQ